MVDVKNLAKKEELITGGTFACSGCQAVYGKRLVYHALGKNTIMINTAGCMTLTTTYPFTPYKAPWVHIAIQNAGAVGTGILMGLRAQGRDKGMNIVAYAGDGASYDIGMQALSGAAHRNENMIFICYNNSSFANTGFQKTAGSQQYAYTSTTPTGKKNKLGNLLPRKNLAKIMAMHDIPYSATTCTSFPNDVIAKLKKAASIKGFKFIDMLCSCQPGWGVEEQMMVEAGRMMVETGIWPMYEIENKKFKLSYRPKMLKVEEAFKLQKRFRHLDKKMIREVQKIVNEEWKMIKAGRSWESNEY